MIKLAAKPLAINFFIFYSCGNNPKKEEQEKQLTLTEEVAQKVAQECGVENWKKVKEIAFTFNVDRDSNHFERSWVWEPQNKKVIAIKKSDTISFLENNLDSTSKDLHKAFINDKFWLLAPFNLVWDDHKNISYQSNKSAPISSNKYNKLTKVYKNEGGYTPGDAYDFYIDENYRIKEWTYRKSNDSIPSLNTTWENYEMFNGIKIATIHKDSSGNLKLYFSNISIKN